MAKKRFKKQLFKIARWLHIYVSTALLALLLFFAITGVTLNNGWYDSDGNLENSTEAALSNSQIERWQLGPGEQWQPDLTAIRAHIKAEFGLSKASSFDIDADMREIFIEYHVPAGGASVIVSAHEQLIIVDSEAGSLLGVLNDLHKGRHSGVVWKWVIDISAILMVLFAITGFILVFQSKKHRRMGLVAVVMGLFSPILLYLFGVPSIGS